MTREGAQLEGTKVTRHFGSFVAVDSVDISIAAHEVVGLVGANGAGKTTLIRILLGLLPPTSGSVRVFGEAPTRETRARIGYVPQLGGLYDDLTATENLAFVERAYGREQRAGLPDDLRGTATTLVGELSLGIRRRLAFAAALSHDPQLLVLDEPTSGVDPLQRARLWDTIRGAAERGLGVLVTTHHMSEADQCDRLLVMASGRVVATGSQAEIIGNGQVVEAAADDWQRTFSALDDAGLLVSLVGRTPRVVDAPIERVREVLAAANVDASLALRPATLDEAFVRLTAGNTPEPAKAA
jgi:ABC-2 type transport system ATP-binding protein/ribosome-dependent ATPase